MMSVLQNSFANSSSSLIQSKITGNLVFVLLAPLSPAGLLRGLRRRRHGARDRRGPGRVRRDARVRAGLLRPAHPAWVIAFALLGSAILGTLGLIAGIWADKFDQLAAFQNFIIVPLTFLSGVFYSIHSLPPVWQVASHFNPFFYMIDGFRYGFFGLADVAPQTSLAIVGAFACLLAALALALIGRGWKLRPDAMADADSIRAAIAAHLPCEALAVDGDGRHWTALVVSHAFDGLSRVARHQRVYAALGERMREEIHALSMTTLTPGEWADAGGGAQQQ
jgi:ABC-2 type transport system permease protein